MGYRSRFFFDIYEKKERDLVKELLGSEDTVLELGACIGVVSCTINRCLKKNRHRHIAVEANAEMIPYLVRNGVTNNSEFVALYGVVNDGNSAKFTRASTITLGQTNCDETSAGESVPGFTIEELFDKFGSFNVLVCDIEGAEYELLQQASGHLQYFKLILIEQHDALIGETAADACRVRLEGAGFRCQKKIGKVEAWLRQ